MAPFREISYRFDATVSDHMGVRRVDISQNVGNLESSAPTRALFDMDSRAVGTPEVARKFAGRYLPWK